MDKLIIVFILLSSISSYASTRECSLVFKEKLGKNQDYTLVKVYESNSLCGFHVTYEQDSENSETSKGHNQIILSKNTQKPILNAKYLQNKIFASCEYSRPINNELNCLINKDLFSIIAKERKEEVFTSRDLQL